MLIILVKKSMLDFLLGSKIFKANFRFFTG